MLPDGTQATRRRLPHLSNRGRTYFVTFVTIDRRVLTPEERAIVLDCCAHDHRRDYWLECAVVMPDHVHIIVTPYEHTSIDRVMQRLKSASSHRLHRGKAWQEESFDRIVRAHEDLRKKAEYTCENPVRAGLVATADEYPWLWREWLEGRQARRLSLHEGCGNE